LTYLQLPAIAITTAVFALGGCANPGASPTAAPAATSQDTAATIVVTVPVGGIAQPAIGAPCGLSNVPPAYYDLLGANAQVKNESGTIVGAVTIPKTGIVRARAHPDEFFDKDCAFDVSLNLAGTATFYVLNLGSSFEPMTISRADLEAAGWRFEVGF
jgi:hypothetical protein